MTKINWAVRLRHPAFYVALMSLIGFILVDMQVIDMGKFEIYSQMILGVLTAGGIVVDFTTPGVPDSPRALSYEEPGIPKTRMERNNKQ